jgi:hypothetical protein
MSQNGTMGDEVRESIPVRSWFGMMNGGVKRPKYVLQALEASDVVMIDLFMDMRRLCHQFENRRRNRAPGLLV